VKTWIEHEVFCGNFPDKSLKISQKVFFESGVNYNFHEMIYLGNVIEAED
jgi:hypothetical protein